MDAEEIKKYEEAVRDVIGMHAFVLGQGGAGYVDFDRWLAAHDAEVRAGVVAEEPEWEYGATNVYDDQVVTIRDTLAEGRKAQEFYTRIRERPTSLMMRTKAIPAGPWVPVKQEGAEANA